MGYTTDFDGTFDVTPDFEDKHFKYLEAFAGARHMKRDAEAAAVLKDPVREAVGLPVGKEGEYFVGDEGGSSVLDHNGAPEGQPGLWCQWVPVQDATGGSRIEWDGGEKFYNYEEWLKYLVKHFLKPWGYELNGEVHWQGEDGDDRGVIYAKNNKVDAVDDSIQNTGPFWEKPRKK